MNNTSNLTNLEQTAQINNHSSFSDLYEEHYSKINAIAPQQVSPEELQIVYENAYLKGYAKGEQEAKDLVLMVAAEELAELKLSLHHLAAGFKAAMTHHAERTSKDMLLLALEISKTMIQAEIDNNREVVLPVIRQALSKLPSLRVPLKLMVHPEDEALVTCYMKESFEGVCEVISDPQLERGGCLLETVTNVVDATNVTRWRAICQSLGYQDDGIEGVSHAG